MRSIIVFFFIWLMPIYLPAQGYFDFNQQLRSAYDDIIALKLESGQKKLDQLKKQQPDNVLVYHIEDYIDFFTIFIGEQKSDFDRLIKNKDYRMRKIRSGDKNSPYYLFCQAEIHLHWATARMKFDQKFDAAREIYAAYNMLEKNQKRFPNFISNQKSLSIIHSVAESIPKWIQKISGIKGSVALGVRDITEIIEFSKNNDYPFKAEAFGIYAYIQFYQNNQREKGYQELLNSGISPAENPLMCFLIAQLAHKTKRPQKAIALLEQRPQGDEYYPFHYLQFMLGNYQLEQLDENSVDNINSFIKNFEGQHFIKEAYQKLGWAALVFLSDEEQYIHYMNMVNTEGKSLIDEDKQAVKEAQNSSTPNIHLLKARLLFDGSQYENAKKVLINNKATLVSNEVTHIEYNYRLGRIYQELREYKNALKVFNLAIQNGKQNSFFACNSALQAALIYEELGQKKSALNFFRKCLKIKSNKYKNSLHQKAKSGINRLQ